MVKAYLRFQKFGVSQQGLSSFGFALSKEEKEEERLSTPSPKQSPFKKYQGVRLKGHTRYFACPECGLVKSEKELMSPLPGLVVVSSNIVTGEEHQEEIPDGFKPVKVEETLWRICEKCGKEVRYEEVNEKIEKKLGDENMANEDNLVNLENTGEVEMEAIEVDKYIGKEVPIESVTEHKGEFGYYIKVTTGVVDTLKSGKELRASRIFGLMTGKDGKVGWTSNSKLGLYLRKMGVSHYRDLKGKVVKIQTSIGKDGNTYMTF